MLLVTLILGQDSQPAASRPASRPASSPANLVPNGDFEAPGDPAGLPAGWTSKHPRNVRLVERGEPHGRAVEMTGDEKLMGGYGVDLTSTRIPVRSNTRYHCTGATKSAGPKMIVFVKGYATVTRSVAGEPQTFEDAVYQMRKDIESSPDWQSFNLDFEFIPARLFSDFQHRIEYVRITLWAYWPAGTCWFNDIRFEEVGPVPAEQQRHPAAVTHTGEQPRLGAAARPATSTAGVELDEERSWLEAVNALRTGHNERAAQLAEQLLAHAPQNASYRVLAARALAALERWDAAEAQVRWLLEDESAPPPGSDANHGSRPAPRQIEPWQRDWARTVQARVYHGTGRTADARAILVNLLQRDCSPHARAAAQALLSQLEAADRKK